MGVKQHFDSFSEHYDTDAFKRSLGVNYLSLIEEKTIAKMTKNEGKLALDAGVGTGRNARILLKNGYLVVGIDLSKKMMKQAGKKLKSKNLKLMEMDLNKKLWFKDKTFDLIICMRVIKYVKNWKATLREFNRVLKPNGKLIVEFANKNSIQRFGGENAQYFLFDIQEVKKELSRNGFVVEETFSGTKIPFPVYASINRTFFLNTVIFIEKISDFLLMKHFSRNYIYKCQRKK